jgi:hypothetical protein
MKQTNKYFVFVLRMSHKNNLESNIEMKNKKWEWKKWEKQKSKEEMKDTKIKERNENLRRIDKEI